MLREEAYISVCATNGGIGFDDEKQDIQSSLYTLSWSYSKQRLCNTSTETGQDGSWARKLAIFISQQALELVKSNES